MTGLLVGDVYGRRQELAIREALGAGTSRVVRHLLSDVSWLAISGGALGVVSAWWITPALVAMAPPGLPRLDSVSVDVRAFGIALLSTLATTVVASAVPALTWTRVHLNTRLRDGRIGARHGQTRQALVVARFRWQWCSSLARRCLGRRLYG